VVVWAPELRISRGADTAVGIKSNRLFGMTAICAEDSHNYNKNAKYNLDNNKE